MRIALPTDEGDDETAAVSGHFGRTDGFTIVDTDADETEFVPHTGGHGRNASPPPMTIIDADADLVIAGDIGRGAVSRLRDAGIPVHRGAEGTVADALSQWREDDLSEVDPGDVHGHGHGDDHDHGHGDDHHHDHDHDHDHGHDHTHDHGHGHDHAHGHDHHGGHGDCHGDGDCHDDHGHGVEDDDDDSTVPPFDR